MMIWSRSIPRWDLIQMGYNNETTFPIQTVYYLAQVHQNMGNAAESAVYCERTLVRQLEGMKFDSVDWAINAATLAQYYVDQVWGWMGVCVCVCSNCVKHPKCNVHRVSQTLC